MPVRILTWNLADAAGDSRRLTEVVAAVREQDPDVAVLPEAYREGQERQLVLATLRFASWGYRCLSVPYQDTDNRLDRHGLGVLVRPGRLAGQPELMRLGATAEERARCMGRTAIQVPVYAHIDHDGTSTHPFTLAAVHLDDRSEATRLEQQLTLLRLLDLSLPTVIAGDLNAMQRDGLRSLAFRLLGQAARQSGIPAAEPGAPRPRAYSVEAMQWAVGRAVSLSTRLGGMATGSVMDIFEARGLQDADTRHRPTMLLAGVPVAQLDHVLSTEHMRATAVGRTVYRGVSDHAALLVKLQHIA